MQQLLLPGPQRTWQICSLKQHLWSVTYAVSSRISVPELVSQFYRLAVAQLRVQQLNPFGSGCELSTTTPPATRYPLQSIQQIHAAVHTPTVQSLRQSTLLPVIRLMQGQFLPQAAVPRLCGTSEQCTHCTVTGRLKTLTASRVGPGVVQCRHQHSKASQKLGACPDTSAWVAQVLSSEFVNEASREIVLHLFQTLTKMLHLIRNVGQSSSPAAQKDSSKQLLASMHEQLPQAIAVLADRAVFLATAEVVPLGSRIHPPVALLLYSSLLHAAPPALRKHLGLDTASPGANKALIFLLDRCTKARELCSKPRFVSMTCRSLALLHECGVWTHEVRGVQAQFLSHMRTTAVKQLDTQAVVDLCSLIAAFRVAPDQRRPRAWYIATARLKQIVNEGPVSLPTAGSIASSVVKMHSTLQPGLEAAVVDAGCLFVTERSARQGVTSPEVAEYLAATAQLQLPIPKNVVEELFMWAINRRSECKPRMVVSMLAALQKLEVQLSRARGWKRICNYVRGGSLDDLESFCLAAQNLVVHESVAVQIARVVSRVAAEGGMDAAQVSTVRQAVEKLQLPARGRRATCKNTMT